MTGYGAHAVTSIDISNPSIYKTIKKLAKEATTIVNAGDADREGQCLIDEVLEHLGNIKPVKRILITDLNPTAVKRALANLKDNAELRIGTDHHDYCRWILARLMENSDFNWKSDHPDQCHQRPDDWPPTRYEQKALTVGRKSAYMTFIRRPR